MFFKSIFYFIENKESHLANVFFYYSCIVLVAAFYFYSIFALKVQLQSQEISEINKRILAVYSNGQETAEKKVLDYKNKIDNFSLVLNNHKNSSNVFSFIEAKALPQVYFSNFEISQPENTVKLFGQADTMAAFSRQLAVFEEVKDYVDNITIVSSKVNQIEKVDFVLNISLDPSIFHYPPVEAELSKSVLRQ